MIDFARVLTDLDGESLKGENNESVTLGSAALNALLLSYRDEAELPGVEKAKRASIAIRIHEGRTDFAVEELALIKRLIGKAYGPLVVRRAWDLLDPEAKD